MSYHLFGAVLTPEGVASNNRGENAGNTSTLQKILRRGEIFTTVSAEAIRYAIREGWSASGQGLNRAIDGDGRSSWADVKFAKWANYVDNDVLGFMDPKEETIRRRGRLEISRAISTRPWTGDLMFNVASPGSHPRGNPDPIPYSVEVHCTRYQYVFGLTPSSLEEPGRASLALEAIEDLSRVAGNHGRYLYEFAPDAVVLRWTHDPVPRLMYCFEESETGEIGVDKLLHALASKDVEGAEVVVGGRPLAHLAERLRELGAAFYGGVKEAFAEVRDRISSEVKRAGGAGKVPKGRKTPR